MNEKLFSILSSMIPNLPAPKKINGGEQVFFETKTHSCSVTIFSPTNNEERKYLEDLKRFVRNDNDIVFLGDVRFSATSK